VFTGDWRTRGNIRVDALIEYARQSQIMLYRVRQTLRELFGHHLHVYKVALHDERRVTFVYPERISWYKLNAYGFEVMGKLSRGEVLKQSRV